MEEESPKVINISHQFSSFYFSQIVVNALAHAIPAIINVVMVILVFWLIFAIVGVQFFGGTFYKCLDGEGEKVLSSIVNNKTQCLTMNMTWKNSDINFDNVFNGYVALFQVATFEGWMEVMEDAVDARGVRNLCHFTLFKT